MGGSLCLTGTAGGGILRTEGGSIGPEGCAHSFSKRRGALTPSLRRMTSARDTPRSCASFARAFHVCCGRPTNRFTRGHPVSSGLPAAVNRCARITGEFGSNASG
jgi:hypothetical protein